MRAVFFPRPLGPLKQIFGSNTGKSVHRMIVAFCPKKSLLFENVLLSGVGVGVAPSFAKSFLGGHQRPRRVFQVMGEALTKIVQMNRLNGGGGMKNAYDLLAIAQVGYSPGPRAPIRGRGSCVFTSHTRLPMERARRVPARPL